MFRTIDHLDSNVLEKYETLFKMNPLRASAPADPLPKVVVESVFGPTVLSEFDVTALKQRRKVQQ